MKSFKQYLNENKEAKQLDEAGDFPYYMNDNIGNLWDAKVDVEGKLVCTDSVKNEYNFIFRVFILDEMIKEFSYDFTCKDQNDAFARVKNAYKKIKNILIKDLLKHANNNLDKVIKSIKI